MTVCNKIGGIALYRHHVLRENPDISQQIMRQMGIFLHQLHHIPADVLQANQIAPSLSRHTREAYLKLYEDIQQELFPIMFSITREWVKYVFEPLLTDETFLDSPSVLIHDDLFQNHILYDEADKQITGIIDFGVAGMGDPAKDIALIINSYGESFVHAFADVYPDLDDALLNRARFYATVLEMVWVMEGIRNKDNAWFTAHLDRARDIRPYS
jgi:aminoglycoside 2''-phosphotransferase